MLFDDPDYSGSMTLDKPVSSLVTTPSSTGIGLAAPTPPTMPAMPAQDGARAEFGKMSGAQQFFTALGEFSAPLAGKPSPMRMEQEERRKEKLLGLQTFKLHNETLEDSVKMLEGLRGDAKTKFVEQQAGNLDKLNPQLGQTFRALSEKPDMQSMIAKYAGDIPQIKMAFELGGEEAVYKLMQSEKFHEYVQKRADVKELPIVTQKVRSMITFLPQFDPALHKKFMKDGVLDRSELDELNTLVSQHPEFGKLALTPEQQMSLHRNDEVALAGLPVLTGKKTQELLETKAKESITHPGGRKPERYDEEKGDVKITYEMRDGKPVEVARAPRWKPGEDPASAIRGAAQANKDRDTELRLSDDYARDTKGFKDTKSKFSAATEYYAGVAKGKAPSPADDRALIFAYAKMLDPGDKVAVKDLQDIAKLGSLPDRVIQGIQNVVKGSLLPPDVRKDMYSTIRKEFTQINRAQSQLEREYGERAGRYKLDPKNVVIPHSMRLE